MSVSLGAVHLSVAFLSFKHFGALFKSTDLKIQSAQLVNVDRCQNRIERTRWGDEGN